MSRFGVQLRQADQQGLPGQVRRGGAQRCRTCRLCPDATAAVEGGQSAPDAQTVRFHPTLPAELRAQRRASNQQDEIPQRTGRGLHLGPA